MGKKSNNQGRGYEFISLLALEEEIRKIRPVSILKNSSYYSAEKAWNTLDSDTKELYGISTKAAVRKIFELEPRILEKDGDSVELNIQPDKKGKEGDVRDIIIARNSIKWEIGLSIKHNHFAAKHSRISHSLDFGKKWYGIPCSDNYRSEIKPVFDYLGREKIKKTKFSELPDKEHDVYIPILSAFINEINSQYVIHKEIPAKLVEYLLGKYDFYKIISIDRRKITQIQSYNLHGTLNQDGENTKSTIEIPIAVLPTRIVSLGFVPDSATTVELYMDGGWQFSFRIHNAESMVNTSLKFDIEIVGIPTAIITINCCW